MCFFENDYFLNILKTYKGETFPMLVPVIVDLAENHWHKILQESLIALKTILKEIDPYAFDEAVKMTPKERKKYAVKQDEEERKNYDSKWGRLN
jgi:serine/threonine-protein phosphatase 2A regulatory subunit B'